MAQCRPRRTASGAARLVTAAALAVWLLVCVAPLAWLGYRLVVYAATEPSGFLADAVPSARRSLLIGRSLALAGAVSLASIGLAVLGAWCWLTGSTAVRHACWAVAALLVAPPYIHASAWVGAMPQGPVAAWIMTIFCQALSLGPLALGVALLGTRSLPRQPLEAAAMVRSPEQVFRRVALPMLRPTLAAGAALVFVLSLSETATPTLFNLGVIQQEIHVVFAQWGRVDRAAAVALLPALTGGLVLWRFRRHFGQLAGALGAPPDDPPRLTRTAGHPTGWLVALVAAPFALTLARTIRRLDNPADFLSGVRLSLPSLHVTALSTMVAAGFCVFVSLPLSRWLADRRRSAAWFLLMLPMVLLPALTGVALVGLWNRPITAPLYDSWVMLSVGQASRFMPVAALVLAALWTGRQRGPAEAAALVPVGPMRRFVAVSLPLAAPAALCAGLAVAALAIRELEIALLVSPPGRQPLSARLFGYLHYGASSEVAADVLLMVVLMLAAAALAALSVRRHPRGQGTGTRR